MFDETCTEHAKSFAKVCIKQYFEGINGEIPSLSSQSRGDDTVDGEEKTPTEEDKLLGIRRQDSMNKVLWDWHACKPPLRLKKLEGTGQNGVANKKEDLSDNNHLNGLKEGYVNPGLDVGQCELDSGCNNANVHAKKNGLTNSFTNANGTSQNGLTNGGVSSPSSAQQKSWAVYYSKV